MDTQKAFSTAFMLLVGAILVVGVVLTLQTVQRRNYPTEERFVVCTNSGLGESCYTSKYVQIDGSCAHFVNEETTEEMDVCGNFRVYDNHTIYTPQG